MVVIKSIVNHKGGVGKTTTTLNLGKSLSLKGLKTLLIDLDPQANLSQSVGIENPEISIFHTLSQKVALPIHNLSENLDIVPSDLELASAESKLQAEQLKGYLALRDALKQTKNNYDYILIDCPPSLGTLTNNALMASNEVMITLSSQFLPTKGMDNIFKAVQYAEEFNANLKVTGILFTMVEKTIMSNSIIDYVRAEYDGLVYDTMIRKNVVLQECTAHGQDIFSYDSKSMGAMDYENLCNEMLLKLEKHGS